MGMLHVRLLVLIVLRTISRCQDISAYLTDVVTVMNSDQDFPSSCVATGGASVRFNEIKLPGPDSDVVYQRKVVDRIHPEFAATAIANFDSDSFLQCAKAAASEGLDAFTLDGTCTGYRLEKRFMCQSGDLVLYLRKGSVDSFPVVTSFEESSYEIIDHVDGPYRQYMLVPALDIVEIELVFEKVDEFKASDLQSGSYNYVFLENQEIYEVLHSRIDLNVCMTDGSYGLPVAITARTDDTFPSVYFFHECGNTVKVADGPHSLELIVYSHPGFGCKYYPRELLPDECTVTFEVEDSDRMLVQLMFIFPETGSDFGTFNVTYTEVNNQDGTTETDNLHRPNSAAYVYDCDQLIVSLTEHPTIPAAGIYIEFMSFK